MAHQKERCLPRPILGIHRSARRQQLLHDRQAPVLGSRHERCYAVHVGSIHSGPRLQGAEKSAASAQSLFTNLTSWQADKLPASQAAASPALER